MHAYAFIRKIQHGFIAVYDAYLAAILAFPLDIMRGFARAAERGEQPCLPAPYERHAMEYCPFKRQQRIARAGTQLHVLHIRRGAALLIQRQQPLHLRRAHAYACQRHIAARERHIREHIFIMRAAKQQRHAAKSYTNFHNTKTQRRDPSDPSADSHWVSPLCP